jgi:hypothetical protein
MGVTEAIGVTTLPPGTYGQIRLISITREIGSLSSPAGTVNT